MFKILLPVAVLLFGTNLYAETNKYDDCVLFDSFPEPAQNVSGTVKVTPKTETDTCYSDIDGKNIMMFFFQQSSTIESSKRTNVVLRFALGDDKSACEKALKDGPYYKGSVIVNEGTNEGKPFMTSVRNGEIEFKKDAYICIHIENP